MTGSGNRQCVQFSLDIDYDCHRSGLEVAVAAESSANAPDNSTDQTAVIGIFDKLTGGVPAATAAVVMPTAAALGRALAPSGEEVGHLATRYVRLGTAFLAIPAWVGERLRKLVEEMVEPRLAHVPIGNRVEPTLEVVGPILEKFPYKSDQPELTRLFANLLANAVDKKTADRTHPSYASTIGELTSLDARILRFVNEKAKRIKHQGVPSLELRHVRLSELATSSAGVNRPGFAGGCLV